MSHFRCHLNRRPHWPNTASVTEVSYRANFKMQTEWRHEITFFSLEFQTFSEQMTRTTSMFTHIFYLTKMFRKSFNVLFRSWMPVAISLTAPRRASWLLITSSVSTWACRRDSRWGAAGVGCGADAGSADVDGASSSTASSSGATN